MVAFIGVDVGGTVTDFSASLSKNHPRFDFRETKPGRVVHERSPT
jgi:N-methylhydantoinase A/oxoprolinase/acetone carboxylase beta subunit